MNALFYTIIFAVSMPLIIALVGDVLRITKMGKLDNERPRDQYANADGIVARSWAAQENAWESAILFSAAALVAHLSGVTSEQALTICLVFCAARILHLFFYLANLSTLRSISFVVALVCCARLFWLAAT